MEIAVGFTGHRPSKKYNTEFMYNFKNPKTLELRDKLIIQLEGLIINKNVTTFISGGALGFDQICFWSIEILKKKYPYIKNIVAIPFKKYNHSWKKKECKCLYLLSFTDNHNSKCKNCIFKETQKNYHNMLKRANSVIFTDEIKGYTLENVEIGEYDVVKLQKRNEYIVDNINILIGFWNGIPSGTKNCIDYAKKQNKEVILINS